MKSVKSVLLATTLVLTVSASAMAQGISVGGQSRNSAAGQLGTGGTLTGSGQAGSNVTAPGATVGVGAGASTDDNSISSGNGAIGAGGAAHGNVGTSGRR
jgi:hypothetical protein